jgi:hypothetical protein
VRHTEKNGTAKNLCHVPFCGKKRRKYNSRKKREMARKKREMDLCCVLFKMADDKARFAVFFLK